MVFGGRLVRISVDRPPLQSGGVQCSDLGGALPFSAPAAPLWGDEPGLLAVGGGSAQAIAEIRALTGWLLGEGCPAVALWGVSMGGWHAGLTACRDSRLTAIVMTVPAVRSNPSISEGIIWRSVRETWREQRVAEEKLDMTPFNLTRSRPVIAKGNILSPHHDFQRLFPGVRLVFLLLHRPGRRGDQR